MSFNMLGRVELVQKSYYCLSDHDIENPRSMSDTVNEGNNSKEPSINYVTRIS